MAPFEELQYLWQSQTALTPPRADGAALAEAFRRYGRRQDIFNIVRVALLAAVFANAVVSTWRRPLVLFAVTLVVLCGALALIAQWRKQRAIARLEFSAASVEFVRDAIARLNAQRNPFHTREFVILFAAAIVGYQLIALAAWHKMTLPERWMAHAGALAGPGAIYMFGRWVRARRWKADCAPLVGRLRGLLRTMEERAL